MSKSALSIIREFSNSSDARLRGNASVGLAALGGTEALRMLLDLSTTDEDLAVRQRAAAEIDALPPDQVSLIKEMILQDLHGPGDCTRTYSIAANLVAAKKAAFTELSPWKSLIYTWRATRFDGKGQRPKHIWYTILSMIAGLCLGWALQGLLLLALQSKLYINSDDSPAAALLFVQVLIMLAIAVLLGLRDIRWQAQARVGLAALVEFAYTASVVLVACFSILLFMFLSSQDHFTEWYAQVGKFLVFAAIALIFVRLTRLCQLIGGRRTAFMRHLLRLAIAMCTGPALLIGYAKTWSKGFEDPYYATVFAFTIPLLTALLTVFIYRDRSYRAPFYPFGAGARWSSLAIPAVFVVSAAVGLLITVIQVHQQSKQSPQIIEVGPEELDRTLELNSDIPIRIGFKTSSSIWLKDGGPFAMVKRYNNKPPETIEPGPVASCVAKKDAYLWIRRTRTHPNISLLEDIGNWLHLAQPEVSNIDFEYRSVGQSAPDSTECQ